METIINRPVFTRRAVVTRPLPEVLPGPLLRSNIGPTTTELLAMIDDGRLMFNGVTENGKKVYELNRAKLGMELETVAPVTFVPITREPVDEEEQPKPKVNKKPTALEKALNGLNRKKKFTRPH